MLVLHSWRFVRFCLLGFYLYDYRCPLFYKSQLAFDPRFLFQQWIVLVCVAYNSMVFQGICIDDKFIIWNSWCIASIWWKDFYMAKVKQNEMQILFEYTTSWKARRLYVCTIWLPFSCLPSFLHTFWRKCNNDISGNVP